MFAFIAAQGIMHEWVFRSGLDHWACFIGMLCAYNYPHYEAFLRSLEQKVAQGRQIYEHLVKVSGCFFLYISLIDSRPYYLTVN